MSYRKAFVYILARQKNGTLYTGITSNLMKRMYEHKAKAHPNSFSAKYNVNKLVWYIDGTDISSAIALEKKIKNRSRAWKLALIEKNNPEWRDLSLDFLDSATTRGMTEGGVLNARKDIKLTSKEKAQLQIA